MRRRSISDLSDPFTPSPTLIAKVGSILVHVEEGSEEGGHHYDWVAVRSLLADRDVQEWLDGLRRHAMVPVKRR